MTGAALGVALATACSPTSRDSGMLEPLGSGGADDGEETSGDKDSDGTDPTDGGTGGGGGGDQRFDIGGAGDGGPGESGAGGCSKVDFLFVVDNSGSMQDEQENLVNSFPGFISTIEGTLNLQDFHIMAVDTDTAVEPGSSNSTCSPGPECCEAFCEMAPLGLCNGQLCRPDIPVPTGCDAELGAGRVTDPFGVECGFGTANRYMVDGQDDLGAAFQCAAQVGTFGSGVELTMEAMVEAVTVQNQAGRCNEGFLRDDAILVVTFITDEEEEESTGTIDSWRQALVEAKGGVETSVVVLGLVGDTDLPGAVCEPFGGGLLMTVGADPAPMLREFAESFTHGLWGSVCAPDYAPFFERAVGVIDVACEDFVPPG